MSRAPRDDAADSQSAAHDDPAPFAFGWPRGMRARTAADYLGISTGLLHAEVRDGRAPKPVRLTRSRLVWLKEDLDAWLDAKTGRPKPRTPAERAEETVAEWDQALASIPGGPPATARRRSPK